MEFDTLSVLESISGRKMSDEPGIDGVYKVYSHLLGRSVFTHELPVIFEHCEPILLAKYPELQDAVKRCQDVTKDNCRQIRDEVLASLPDVFNLEPLDPSDWPTDTHRLLAGKPVIGVAVEGGA